MNRVIRLSIIALSGLTATWVSGTGMAHRMTGKARMQKIGSTNKYNEKLTQADSYKPILNALSNGGKSVDGLSLPQLIPLLGSDEKAAQQSIRNAVKDAVIVAQSSDKGPTYRLTTLGKELMSINHELDQLTR